MKTFKERVYASVAKIPKGKVATYGQIARLAGRPRAARAVGGFMARNQDPKRVPCHRVIASTGALTGYAFNGISAKRAKLLSEGVAFKGAKVNLGDSRWKA